jgi:tRNA-dihydrouridine synthase
MAELSHRALRELIEGFGGCDGYYTEMIGAGALVSGGRFEDWYLESGPCPDKLIYQLVGADSGRLAVAAALLDKLPGAGIDINMGCSAPAIARTGAGVRWMAFPQEAAAMIGQVRRATGKRLSVKLRLAPERGIVQASDGPDAVFDYLLDFCRRLVEAGLDFVVLHPRTADEKFRRAAHWDYVARLRAALDIPVGGNGDIDGPESLLIRAQGPWDAVMAGRAAVRQPWIFAQARQLAAGDTPKAALRSVKSRFCPNELHEAQQTTSPHSPFPTPNLEETGLRFLDLLAKYQPPEFHLSRARRFFNYFCDNLRWAHYQRTRLNRETGLKGIARVWQEYFRETGDSGLSTAP